MKFLAIVTFLLVATTAHAEMPDIDTDAGAAYYAAMGMAMYQIGLCEKVMPAPNSDDLLRAVLGPDIDSATGKQREVVGLMSTQYVRGKAAAERLVVDEATCARELSRIVEDVKAAQARLP